MEPAKTPSPFQSANQTPATSLNQLESKLQMVQRLGFEVHYDWFGGVGGGACQLGLRRCLFLDLAQNTDDHLAAVEELLAECQVSEPEISDQQIRKAA